VPFQVHRAQARGILIPTCGFIAQAGFTHSLSPARNCTLGSTDRDIIADPFHARAVKTSGATTREAGRRISEKRGYLQWHEPPFQTVERMLHRALRAGRRFGTGARAFSWLAEVHE
jgi:hypothetical protein